MSSLLLAASMILIIIFARLTKVGGVSGRR